MSRPLDDNISLWGVLRGAPPLPFLPVEVHGTGIVALVFFSPSPQEEVQGAIDTVRSFGTPVGEHVGAVPYTAWQQVFDPLLVPPARNYWKSHNFNTLSDAALDVVVDYAGKLPSTESEIFLGLIGGAANTHAAGRDGLSAPRGAVRDERAHALAGAVRRMPPAWPGRASSSRPPRRMPPAASTSTS